MTEQDKRDSDWKDLINTYGRKRTVLELLWAFIESQNFQEWERDAAWQRMFRGCARQVWWQKSEGIPEKFGLSSRELVNKAFPIDGD